VLCINLAADAADGGDVDLQTLRLQAQQAEKSGFDRAGMSAERLWFNLAFTEMQEKQIDSAVAHIKHAISLIYQSSSSCSSRDTYCNGGLLSRAHTVLSALAKAGRAKQAESLALEAASRTKAIYGADSLEYECDLACLFEFYAAMSEHSQALKYLDEMLALDPRKLEFGRYAFAGRCANLIDFAASGLTEKNTQFSLQVLQKVLASQQNYYGPNDLHVAAVLTGIARVQIAANDNALAEVNLRRALSIERLYGGSEIGLSGSHAKTLLLSLLTKEKKLEAVERLNNEMQALDLSRKEHWSLPAGANRAQMQQFYEWWQKEAPYSLQTEETGLNLVGCASKEKDWKHLVILTPQVIDCLAHNSLCLSICCVPSPSPVARKFLCYKSLIDAYLNLGEKAEALKWLDRAVSEKSYQPGTEELLFLSDIENLCGNKAEAISFCKEAEKSLSKAGSNYYLSRIIEQYKKTGAQADYDRLIAEAQLESFLRSAEELRKQHHSESLQAKSDPVPKGSAFAQVISVKEQYIFNYAALASSSLVLGEGTKILRHTGPTAVPGPPFAYAGSLGNLQCSQPINTAGNLKFIYDGVPDSLVVNPNPFKVVPGRNFMVKSGAPDIPALPFCSALSPPVSAALLGSKDTLVLKPGDYKLGQLTAQNIVLPETGRVRIFLTGTSLAEPAFLAKSGAVINQVPTSLDFYHPLRLELWYNGPGTIRLDENTLFNGLIYAPNARIELGDFVRFKGAMVAREISAGKNTAIIYEPRAMAWTPQGER
jgi:hypothetical protein